MPAPIEKEAFYDAMADVIAREYVLTPKVIEEIIPKYGWSLKTNAGDVLNNHVAKGKIACRGLELYVKQYKGHIIYRPDNLDEDAPDLVDTKRKIDEAMIRKSRPGSSLS